MGEAFASQRLVEERKNWRKDHPIGFVAKPSTRKDGSTNMLVWDCVVPGKEKTPWEGGNYPIQIRFPETFPADPPACYFPEGFLHPNVYPSGKVCLSLLNPDHGLGGQWAPSISVKQILLGIQNLLEDFNLKSAAQSEAYNLIKSGKAKYEKKIREQAKKFASIET